jgi:hypothetical protein
LRRVVGAILLNLNIVYLVIEALFGDLAHAQRILTTPGVNINIKLFYIQF